MSRIIWRTTLPLPWRRSQRTTAPCSRAISPVPSEELLWLTYTVASGSTRRKSSTTLPMVTASL